MKRLYCVLCAAGFLAMSGAALGSTALPYASGFEGAFNPNVDPWTAVGGTVQQESVLPKGGLNTCIVSNALLSLNVNPTTYSNAWFQIWAKPVAGTNNPDASSSSGAFYIKNNGHLMVYTGAWIDVGSGYPSNASTWIGFAAHVDYPNNKWDLYSTKTASTTTSMTKVAANLPLAGVSAHLSSVSVQSGDKVAIDQVAVAQGFQTVTAASPGKVLPYEFAAALSTNVFTLPVYADTYTNGNDSLAGVLGNDLLAGLTANDLLGIYGASSWTYPQRQSGGVWAPSTAVVKPTTALALIRQPASRATWGFFAYNQNQAVAFNGVKDTNSPPVSYSLVLNGPGASAGYTEVLWPTPLASLNVAAFPITYPDANLAGGDRLYVAKSNNLNAYDEYYWNASLRKWMSGAQVASKPIPAGSIMWLKRANATATVIVSL